MSLAVVAILNVVAVPPIYADDPNDAAKAVSVVALGASPAVAAALVAEGSGSAMLASSLGVQALIGSIMALGVWREIVTDPAKQGLYRYNGQSSATGENRKWERDPHTKWMKLKAYESL